MRVFRTATCAALLAGFVGLAAAPAALAQAGPPGGHDQMGGPHRMMPGWHKGEGGMKMRMRHGRGLNLIAFGCGERAAERLEVAFVRLSHRIELTDTQKPLFDNLKTAALTEQTKVADACAAAMPERDQAERPDVVDHLKARLAVETARVAALETVVPEFEAFFDSLSDEQKADMMPRRMRMHTGMAEDGEGNPPAPHGKRPMPGKTM